MAIHFKNTFFVLKIMIAALYAFWSNSENSSNEMRKRRSYAGSGGAKDDSKQTPSCTWSERKSSMDTAAKIMQVRSILSRATRVCLI